jgi:hypothetical protein
MFVKNIFKSKGFFALSSLAIGSLFLITGLEFLGGVFFGMFFLKNAEAIKDIIKTYEI